MVLFQKRDNYMVRSRMRERKREREKEDSKKWTGEAVFDGNASLKYEK